MRHFPILPVWSGDKDINCMNFLFSIAWKSMLELVLKSMRKIRDEYFWLSLCTLSSCSTMNCVALKIDFHVRKERWITVINFWLSGALEMHSRSSFPNHSRKNNAKTCKSFLFQAWIEELIGNWNWQSDLLNVHAKANPTDFNINDSQVNLIEITALIIFT